jgi:tetratricopeptide (TPR) repeat protein
MAVLPHSFAGGHGGTAAVPGAAEPPAVDVSAGAQELDDCSDPAGATNPAAELVGGDVIASRFSVERLARRGGMATVYRARDLDGGGYVALKVMDRVGRSYRERFAREAALLAELSHPAIVGYIAHGSTPEGTPYLVMDWLDGEDLSDRLARGPLDPEGARRLVRRIADALAVAHARGVVHRDVKPSNLFLSGGSLDGVKVLDFGIARLGRAARALTGGGSLLGTVGYMAPEQAMGAARIDARADVFALGCVLYQCLTGRAPFESAHPVAVLAKVLRQEPSPPTELRPELDPRIDALIARLLAKNPDNRPRDAFALIGELDALGPLELGTSPRSRRSSTGLSRAEQRIVSVIIGRPSKDTAGGAETAGDLNALTVRFPLELSPLSGGAVLAVLSGRGEANDRASQASQCAIAMRQLCPGLRIAVATGLVESSANGPVGAAIDRAAALLAEPEGTPGIYLDDLTVGLIGLRFELRSEGSRTVLVGERRGFQHPRPLMGKPTPCVGRDKELKLLQGVLDECINDSVSRAVLVTGPPGIGKSRLASEWLVHSQPPGTVRALMASAEPMTTGSALSLVQQLVRYAVGLTDGISKEEQRALLVQYAKALAGEEEATHLADFLGEVIGVQAEGTPDPILHAARNNPEIMREQIRRALEGWLDGETRRHPVILVLEDLHWGDAPSVLFLTESLRRFADRPFMVFALARPEAEQDFPALCREVALQVRLPRLTTRAAERLVRSALGEPLDPEIVVNVVRIADGNPFYLEELIRRVAAGSTEWPDTVLAMAQSRLEHLDADARHVLRAASVLGEACWAEGVGVMIERSVDVTLVLDSLVEREILFRPTASRYASVREYRFRHALLRDAAYAMLTGEDREAAHRAAGDWLEQVGETDARLLADHFEAGCAAERAIPWSVRAARAAIDSGDIPSAIELSKRGVRLGASGVERGLLLLARGYAQAWSGQADLDVLREALGLLPVGSGQWWLGLSLLVLAASTAGRPDQANAYVRLVAEAPPTSELSGSFGQGLLTLVGGLVLLGQGALASSILERTTKAVPIEGDIDPVFEAFLSSARCAMAAVAPLGGTWRLEYAFRGGERSVDWLRRLGATCAESMALNYYAVAATHLGRYAEARAACLESIAVARRTSSGLNQEWARVFLAKACVRLGEPDEALATVELLLSSPDRNVLQMLPVIAAEAKFRKRQLDASMDEARLAFGGLSPRIRRLAGAVLARAELASGHAPQALSTVESALSQPTSGGLESDVDLLTVRAEARLATGDIGGARAAVAEARNFILSIAQTIDDAELRRSFLENVEPCARALRLSNELAPG